MRFPQWAYSHRHCASSVKTRSRSCWLRPIGPPGPGFPNTFPSRQHLPGALLWGRTSSLQARHYMAPASRSMEPPCVAPGRDAADLSGLPPAVVETIIQARAPAIRQTYALKWSLFANWCPSRREDPRRCTIGVVLSFLQERLECRLSPSTLKVYVATIAAHHNAVDGRSPGKAWSHREVPEGGQEDESLQVTPCALLGSLYRPGWTSEGPLWAAGLSRAEVTVY